MTRHLSDSDISGAFREMAAAVAELAIKTGQVPARAELSDAQELEILRLTAAHPGMLRQEAPAYPEGDFRETSAAAEILRLTSTHPREFGVSRSGGARPGARARRDSEVLALSRTTASPADGQLVSKWGLPVTVAGVPVTSENSERLGLGRVLPPMVADVTDDPAEDISSWVGRSTGGLGDGPDQPPDLGVTDPSFGEQTDEVSNPYAVASPHAEVNRLVQAGAAAGITGLRTGAKKARHPQTGRFTSKQARLTGTLSGI